MIIAAFKQAKCYKILLVYVKETKDIGSKSKIGDNLYLLEQHKHQRIFQCSCKTFNLELKNNIFLS